MKSFAIVGGGASGVLAAAQLLGRDASAHVDIFEPRAALAAGIAYGTKHPGHLLNVPARGMSAFADEPDHFVKWLEGQHKWQPAGGWTPQSFVPRRLYRDYLSSLVAPYLAEDAPRLLIHHTEVVDLVEHAGGVELVTTEGGCHRADCAILATGNESPGGQAASWRLDYWSNPSGFDIPRDARVVVIGTGLSMIDSVISLLDAGHTAPINAISRRGLVPRPHDLCPPVAMDAADVPFGASIATLSQWLRSRVRSQKRPAADDCSGNWRAVVDGLRPHTQALWRSLPQAERQRFLRHARPWWDVHRHRMAPEIHARIETAITSGQLRIHAGRLAPFEEEGRGVTVSFTPRGTSDVRTVRADYVIDCRGQNTGSGSTGNGLLATLMRRGTLRPDTVRLALDVSEECAVLDRDGSAAKRIFAVGPATLGTFWEIVAMPDIRVQVQQLAESLTAGEENA